MNDLRYLPDVVTLQYTESKCTGCGLCAVVCPRAVFKMRGDKAQIVGRDLCIECGACALNCPGEAISVRAGVGCASGIINGLLRNSEPTCDCSDNSSCC